ncbi:hypothetical protein HPP92_021586 [Vanilla planifolia]|uniref:SEC7 domain-containing protein n=1 Tax=Vanilla planifolia TaxID=51239 RepID=A0A835Q2N8_VANPL|nr:hypothetical protein HPP92_021586 [Vanilla planifolia]
MKFAGPGENPEDPLLLRGKVVSLELLKLVMENAGTFWTTNERQVYCFCLSGVSALSGCLILIPSDDCRVVNGLVKTALGVPAGSSTTLTPTQDVMFGLNQSVHSGEEGTNIDYELHSDANSGFSDTATLEQRRAYKIEFQKGISLFNRKPSKGIEFLINSKKIGGSPEAVAAFLKNTAGLNATMIGDYLGERDEFNLKVMHSYVDSLNFEFMDFGEAIRFLLRGFRLPGEAQKIDRIMEKFAERYCKCNPSAFSSADTAYVLAYSVIMLNTDAHNSMVKVKMSKVDFVRNNRGIDDGKDLPEDYLGTLYDTIVKNEIKMNADTSVPQNKQASSINKLLGLDNILNLVNWKQTEEKALGASDVLIRHIQEQFKAKSSKSESVFYSVTDAAILTFMMEVCWAPMMAAFSVTLDQSDDKSATSLSLLGFRYAVHITSVMYMQTQRDAFVTSVAKFTYLHCAADMKQKNVDAVKAIMSIAIEDGNYLQEAWEHVLTCLSRFEHLLLLGEGAPPESSFFSVSVPDPDEKLQKNLKKKGSALQNPAVMAVVRGGSYDSASVGTNLAGLVSPEQINNFISNLNLLDQIGNFELNHIFAHSQRLNGDAIVAFVKALCKVSMAELQSPTDPRVFSLTKIVEIAHYNMNRIRLVWSRIWNVLSDFFVLSLCRKSTSSEIRELIVRCVTHMVLTRVGNVKSGWKSVFTVFTIAAADEWKNIVLLAFGTMEKIVRDYFPYITETETTTFTDCVKCLIAFTNSKFNSDASLNAIAFLRFCAVKLAEGGLVCYDKNKECNHANPEENISNYKDDHVFFWVPLLSGLSKLTSDPRPTIRKGAVEVLFDILKDHGHLFSSIFWINIFKSAIYPVFNMEQRHDGYLLLAENSLGPFEEESAYFESDAVAVGCLIELFTKVFVVVRSELVHVLEVLYSYIKSPCRQLSNIGLYALLRLTDNLGQNFSEKEWKDVSLVLKFSAEFTFPVFSQIVDAMSKISIPDRFQTYSDAEDYSDHESSVHNEEDANMEKASYAIVRLKDHVAVLLSIVEVIQKLYEVHKKSFSASHVGILLEILSSVASHSSKVNSEASLHQKLEKVCSLLEIPEPPVVHLENECHQRYLRFLKNILRDNVLVSDKPIIESRIVSECENVLQIYLTCSGYSSGKDAADNMVSHNNSMLRRVIPLPSAKKEELAARTSLIVLAIRALNDLDRDTFRHNLRRIFPLLVNLVRSEHSSGEVSLVLCEIFRSSIGPIVSTM